MRNILLGHDEFGKELVLNTEKFLNQRLLFQGISGSWKTETIKKIIKGLKEVTKSDQNPTGVQQIIFDWEGEYHPLRKSFPYLLIGEEGEFPATVNRAEDLAIEIRKTGASVIIDLTSFDDFEKRQEFVAIFLNGILDVPKQYWKPCVVIIDEAHNLCRQGESRSPSKKPIIRLCETGRKRGISTILVTQRLAALDKNASAQMVNRLIGLTVEVPDREAAARLLGKGRDVADAIKDFEGGEYFAFGSALSEREVRKFKVPKDEVFEKPDLLNITQLNNFGQQVFQELSDKLNGSERTSESLSGGYVDEDTIKQEDQKWAKENNVDEIIKQLDSISPEYKSDSVSDSLADQGRVSLTQSELRKVKLESWNNAFEYILQASQVRKGILRRKIDVLDIMKIKTTRNEDKYVIKGFQESCTKCGKMLEGKEKVVCSRCIASYTERRK